MNRTEDGDHNDYDNGDNNNNLVQSILTYFTCLINFPYANYKVSRSKEMQNITQAHIQKTKQGNMYNLDNYHSISVITPAMMRWEEIYIYIYIYIYKICMITYLYLEYNYYFNN
jgi:hypothetical protein